MRWVEALKIWNGEKGGAWCVPRKGTEEHAAVKAIMAASKAKVAEELPKKHMEQKAAPVAEKKGVDLRHFLMEAMEKRKAAKAAKQEEPPKKKTIAELREEVRKKKEAIDAEFSESEDEMPPKYDWMRHYEGLDDAKIIHHYKEIIRERSAMGKGIMSKSNAKRLEYRAIGRYLNKLRKAVDRIAERRMSE